MPHIQLNQKCAKTNTKVYLLSSIDKYVHDSSHEMFCCIYQWKYYNVPQFLYGKFT